MVEVEKDNTRNIAGTGLGFGIAGTALGLLQNGGLANILSPAGAGCGCSDDHMVNRYEAAQASRIAELESEVKLRDANAFTMGEMNRLRNYVDAKFDAVNAQVNAQAVINAQVTANLSCMQGQIGTLMGLTKTVIPIGNVCPSPMPQFNSFTVPTTSAATT